VTEMVICDLNVFLQFFFPALIMCMCECVCTSVCYFLFSFLSVAVPFPTYFSVVFNVPLAR